MTNLLTRFIRWLGFGKRPAPFTPQEGAAICDDVDRRIAALTKNARLAYIARTRSALKDELERAKKAKKARRHIYAHLESLRNEELELAGDLP